MIASCINVKIPLVILTSILGYHIYNSRHCLPVLCVKSPRDYLHLLNTCILNLQARATVIGIRGSNTIYPKRNFTATPASYMKTTIWITDNSSL